MVSYSQGSELSPRQQDILLAVVREYIETGGPVSSKTVQEKYATAVSRATIRNELAEMERRGYLVKPHTSAGRVPQEKAYRFYVDKLGGVPRGLSREQTWIRGELHRCPPDLVALLRTATRLLSDLTTQPALASEPVTTPQSFSQFRLTSISARSIRITYETPESGERELIWEPPRPLREEQIQSLSKALESAFTQQGLPGFDVEKTAATVTLGPEIIRSLLHLLMESGEQRVYMEGAAHLLNYPEFRQQERLQELMAALAHEGTARALLGRAAQGEGVTVLIGSEHGRSRLRDCSLIAQTYRDPRTRYGAVAVLGPMRMSYRRTMSAVHWVAGEIARRLGEVQANSY